MDTRVIQLYRKCVENVESYVKKIGGSLGYQKRKLDKQTPKYRFYKGKAY